MSYTAEVLGSRAERRLVDFDPDATGLTLVDLDPTGTDECLAIDQYRRFIVGFMRTVGTGALSGFEVIAATDADGTGATQVEAHALGSQPDAVGDYIWIEVDVEQVRDALETATHIGVRIDFDTSTDEGVVYFERADPYFPRTGLTADYVS